MEEINLKEFFTFYKKFILGVIAVCLVFVVITLLFNIFIKKPLYSTSTTLILVNNENDTSQTISQNDILLNQKLVSSYSRIVKSRLVLEQVIDNLNLEYDFEDLYDEVEVASVNDTEIFEIKVTDKDADVAYNIASEITTVFDKESPKQLQKIYQRQLVASGPNKIIGPDID